MSRGHEKAPRVWFSTNIEGAKRAALFRRACAMGLEGIVSKRMDTPYRCGRSWAGAVPELRPAVIRWSMWRVSS
jgi:hypothetical protein